MRALAELVTDELFFDSITVYEVQAKMKSVTEERDDLLRKKFKRDEEIMALKARMLSLRLSLSPLLDHVAA